MKKVLFVVTFFAFLLSFVSNSNNAQAQTDTHYTVPEIRLPLMQKAPTIDGVIQESEWQEAGRMERFGRPHPLSPQKAGFWIGADEQNLYLAVRTETPPGGQLLQRANPLPGDTDARSFEDDSIELYFSLNPDAVGAQQRIYQGIFNAKGAIYDQLITPSGAESWRGRWNIKNSTADDYWSCEISIPWSDLGLTNSPLGHSMALRIARNWRRSTGSTQTEWSPLEGVMDFYKLGICPVKPIPAM